MKRAFAALVLVLVSGCASRTQVSNPLDFRFTDTRAYPQADSRFYAHYYAYPKDAAYINSSQLLRFQGRLIPYWSPEATSPPPP